MNPESLSTLANPKVALDAILNELITLSQAIDPDQLNQAAGLLEERYRHHQKVFLAGAGRSGLVASLFANRLVHLGFSVFRTGEVTAGPIEKDDLLIIVSGSGKTTTLLELARKAISVGARLLVITLNESSPLSKSAAIRIVLPGTTRLMQENSFSSIQPVGSCFEQLAFLACETLVVVLQQRLHLSDEDLLSRHANLE
ncbi:6-phospho-3-hexuloisomerase [Erysipelotrichaceae bacterium 51-3]